MDELETLVEIFQRRDGMTLEEAEELLQEMKDAVEGGEDPEEVLAEQGLEPDWVLDLFD